MGNTREWTTKFNANNEALKRLLRAKGCTSISKRRKAMEVAATLPNRLPARRLPIIQGDGKP